MADRLVTPEELASVLQKDLDRSTSEILIEGATAVVQAFVGQRLLRATSTVAVEPVYGGLLPLPERPVVSVQSVQLAGEILVDGTDYQLVGNELFRYAGWRSHTFGGLTTPVIVSYTHGYEVGNHMLELARSTVLTLASQAYANPDGASREQIGDYSIAFSSSQSALDGSRFLRMALIRRYGGGAGLVTLGAAT